MSAGAKGLGTGRLSLTRPSVSHSPPFKKKKKKKRQKQTLSHVVVLVGVLFVTLHVVPVNKRLYSFLQVSRLERKTEHTLTENSGYFKTR